MAELFCEIKIKELGAIWLWVIFRDLESGNVSTLKRFYKMSCEGIDEECGPHCVEKWLNLKKFLHDVMKLESVEHPDKLIAN